MSLQYVTIITPARNEESLIELTIQSCRAANDSSPQVGNCQ